MNALVDKTIESHRFHIMLFGLQLLTQSCWGFAVTTEV